MLCFIFWMWIVLLRVLHVQHTHTQCHFPHRALELVARLQLLRFAHANIIAMTCVCCTCIDRLFPCINFRSCKRATNSRALRRKWLVKLRHVARLRHISSPHIFATHLRHALFVCCTCTSVLFPCIKITSHKRATSYRALLQKMIYKYKASLTTSVCVLYMLHWIVLIDALSLQPIFRKRAL